MGKSPISPDDLKRTLESSVDSGKATAGGNSTLTDTNKNWPTNVWLGLIIEITEGTGKGQIRQIASNTATVITNSAAWGTNPDASSEYRIGFFGTITGSVTVSNTVLVDDTNLPGTPTPFNGIMTTASVEYSVGLVGVKLFEIKMRDLSAFRLAWQAGVVATGFGAYITVPANIAYESPRLSGKTTITLYFASDSAGKIAEVIRYT